MLAVWKRVEGLDPSFLVLSAGDVATGPAISTVFQGVPAIEVMNAMGYDASALGNHEFDFGMDQLKSFQKLARFPFLSANVLAGAQGDETLVPAFCVKEKAGIKIGILGLMTLDLKRQDIRVNAYAEALRRWAPKARLEGAQVLLVLAHVPLSELRELASTVGDLGIPLMMGGHSHELGQAQEPGSGTWIVNSGEWWRAYSRIDLDYNPVSGNTKVESSRQVWLRQGFEPDNVVQKVVNKWQAKLDQDSSYAVPLGYLASPLELFWPVSNFVCDAWLAMDPKTDIVLNNDGSLRQALPPGPVTRAQLVGLMPFNDKLLRFSLSGRKILSLLPGPGGLMGVAGISRKGGKIILSKTGKPLDPKAHYQVLMNDYMAGVDLQLLTANSKGQMVAKDWRDPVEQWLIKHPSSATNPLEKILDSKPRL